MADKKAAVLWTGGKDSCLALYEAIGAGYDVQRLVTFAPPQPRFLAHPIEFMRYQAEALALPHDVLELCEPWADSYRRALRLLAGDYGITHIITGDIDEIPGHSEGIRSWCEGSGLTPVSPLWKRDRRAVLDALAGHGFSWMFSLVRKPWFAEDWIGTMCNADTVRRLYALEGAVDICGENGEYHSLVVDGPLFGGRVCVERFSRCEERDFWYIHIEKISLERRCGEAAGTLR